MPSVVPTLESDHRGRSLGKEIDDLALSLVAPLGTDDNDIFTHDF
jgi:hypothetical protein